MFCIFPYLCLVQVPRYLHACTSLRLNGGEIGVLVAGGYADNYLNSTEIYFPKTNS